MKAYSKEKWGEVLADCDAGMFVRDVAIKHHVSESWIRRIKQERRELGKLGPSTTRKRKPIWLEQEDAIREAIERKPDLTLRELKKELKTNLSVVTQCKNYFRHCGYRYT